MRAKVSTTPDPSVRKATPRSWPGRWRLAATSVGMALFVAGGALAQGTTASIRGVVRDVNGPIPIAVVVAVDNASGFRYTAKAGPDGSYLLPGLKPATYVLTASSEAYKEQTSTLQVLLGQEAVVNFTLSPSETVAEAVTVVGGTSAEPIDVRSSEVATNITRQQIENLPQNNRNFLAFAGLAPGVRFTDNQDAAGQSFSSGAADAKQVNVFIDGLSYKNDIIQGGAFMQDSSRGNPFPQNAVQEYKVLTQNYKAEYEKAAAAVITAVTKSGGNDFHGDLFYFDQTKGMVTQDEFSKARGDQKADYKRRQLGLSLGGAIIKDKLHFFVSGEQNRQDRAASVFRGGSFDSAPANVQQFLSQFPTGTLTVPFDSKLYFGKLSWQPSEAQTFDLSYNRRNESEVRGFGGQRVRQGAEQFDINADAGVLRHQWVLGGGSLNEASLTWQKAQWNPTAFDPTDPHLNYFGLLDVGGKDSSQNLQQKKTGLRDDWSVLLDWHGSHTVKTGVTANFMKYDMTKTNDGNPVFNFRSDEGWQFPFEAFYGFGNPSLRFNNTELGLFLQDDWQVLPNLTVNAGVRWDYESNMLNNDWRTPDALAAGLRTACRTYAQPIDGQTTWCAGDILNLNNYISTGSNRTSYKGMIQPRIGFTWDVSRKGETVVFGGWGKYYDRVTLNDIFDEQFRHTWKIYHFCFSADGSPTPNCGNAIKWDPSFLSAAGLNNLITQGAAGGPEVYLVANDTRPPYTNQWTLGVRQKLGAWVGSLTYANSRGYNGLVWNPFLMPADVPFNQRFGSEITVPGYGRILFSNDLRRTWYDGYFVTLDKPYTPDSRWGANIAYTYSNAFDEVNDASGTAFAFDYVSPRDWYKFPATNYDRNRLVMSGTVGLPWSFRASSIITLGSGVPYDIFTDQGAQFNAGRPRKFSFLVPGKWWAYRSVDLRIEWDAPAIANTVHVGLIAEGFNIFNYSNYNGWENFFPTPPAVNPIFGQANSAFNTRRYQVGLRVSF